MTLADVKQYLRVDGDDDDVLIRSMMDAAEEYIIGAVGKFDQTSARARMLYLTAVQDMYDNRQLVAVSSTGYSASQYLRHMVHSLVTQLQVEQMMDPEPTPEPGLESAEGTEEESDGI